MHLIKSILIYSILYLYTLSAIEIDFNPYKVLGLPRTASDKDIRQAYKKLAKYWHPDKNSEPDANEQFTKINAAYEILSDSTKRQNYDQYGTTSQDNQQGFHNSHFRDPFDMFRAHFFHETSSGAKKIIYLHDLLSNILPNSDTKPYLIFGSTNFCFHCRQPLANFRAMEKQLNDVGIGTGEFNINDERLSNELGILNSPSLCVISQGRVYHFNEQDYSEIKIKEFVRKSIPIKRFIRTLNSYDDILTMISSYNQSNRVHALLITRQKIPTLKFVIPCLQYSKRIQCGVFNLSVIKSNQFPTFLNGISSMSDSILLFKEDINNPEIVIKEYDFTFDNIQKIFESNQLLHLPVITSQNVFDLVCQTNSAKPCFLLIGDLNLFKRSHSSFLRLSKQLFQEYKTHMAYLDLSSTQPVEFNKIFSSYYEINDKKLLILAAHRWSDTTIEIQNTNIEFDEKTLVEFQRNINDIEENLKLFINHPWHHVKKLTLPKLTNNDPRNENIFIKLIDQLEYKWNYWIERNRILRYFSGYLYSYNFWFITILVFLYMYYTKQEPTKSAKKSDKTNQVKVYKFNESLLERYTKPGASNVIMLVLIADTSKDLCVKEFIREINLIKNPHMIYSVLYLDQSSEWLNQLRNKIEDNQNKQKIQFNPSTVLALYIRRKFFVSYSSITNNTEQSLTFSDWIDLLFNGNFREPINIIEWPMKFH